MEICHKVEKGVQNRDARVVQYWLFQNQIAQIPKLSAVDGKAGKDTDTAIRYFQESRLGKEQVTGAVELNDATWAALVKGAICTMDSSEAPCGSVGRDGENLQENVAMVESNLILCHALKAEHKISSQYAPGTSIPAEKLTPLINALTDFQTQYMANGNCNSGFLEMGDETYTALKEVAGKDRNLQVATGMSNFEILEKVWHNPSSFLENSGLALKESFKQFIQEMLTGNGLQTHLFNWLSRQLGADIKAPATWDARGIVEMGINALKDTLGFSSDSIKDYVRNEVGNDMAFDAALESVEILKLVIKDGPMAAWDHIKSEATDLASTTTQLFVDELKVWLRDQLITKVLAKIIKLFVPGGNALVIIDTIYTAFTTIRDYAAQFQSLFHTLSQSVAALANGDRSQAVSQLKAVLHDATAIAIGFLAKFAGFNQISQQVKAAIKKAEKQLKEVFEKIKKKVLAKVEAFIGGKDKKKDGKKKEGEEEQGDGKLKDTIVGKEVEFKTKHETHHTWIKKEGTKLTAMVASDPTPVAIKLNEWERELSEKLDPSKHQRARNLIAEARSRYEQTMEQASQADRAIQQALQAQENPDAVARAVREDNETEAAQEVLAHPLRELFELFEEKAVHAIRTQISYASSGRLQCAVADPLTLNPGKGAGTTSPIDNIPGSDYMKTLNAPQPHGSSNWDRAHLIGHQFGGPSDNIANLVIMESGINKSNMTRIENQISTKLKLLAKDNDNPNQVIYCDVRIRKHNRAEDDHAEVVHFADKIEIIAKVKNAGQKGNVGSSIFSTAVIFYSRKPDPNNTLPIDLNSKGEPVLRALSTDNGKQLGPGFVRHILQIRDILFKQGKKGFQNIDDVADCIRNYSESNTNPTIRNIEEKITILETLYEEEKIVIIY